MRNISTSLVLFASAVSVAADIGGTDVLAGAFAKKLETSGALVADFAGTLPGRQAFLGGRVSAAILLMREHEKAPALAGKVPVEEFRLGAAVGVVAVHASNKTEQLTLENLVAIFSAEARSSALNWNDLTARARSEIITPAVCSPPGTMALEVFQGLVMEGASFRGDVRLRVDAGLASDLLASRAGSVVLLPRPPIGPGRVLPVADGRAGRSTTAYLPDENNVHNGDYPVQLPLMVYVRQDKLAALKPALRWLFSDEAAALLEKQGLFPAPKAARDRFAQRLDTR